MTAAEDDNPVRFPGTAPRTRDEIHRGPLEPNPELPGIIAELGGYCPTCQRFICNCIARREAQP
jgi:hypothetical protein